MREFKEDILTAKQRTEQAENRLAANKLLFFAALGITLLVIEEMGFFYVPKTQFRIAIYIFLVMVALIQVFGRVSAFSGHTLTKFVIVILTFFSSLVMMTILNFHAVLLLLLPIVIAFNYHSVKISRMTFVLTVLCGLLWPLLSLYFKTWDISFFAFLIGEVNPDLVKNTSLADFMVVDNYRWQDVLLFVSLPQMGFAIVFGIMIRISNMINKDKYEKQISRLNESCDTILSGLSNLVENRDVDTGNHIKNTSEVVKLIIDELSVVDGKKIIDDDYADCVIRTASMHDLGKIVIPDAILNKPGRLTPEEFNHIKLHSEKGGEIVESVFSGLDDELLTKVGTNIAMYHHERYDGSGYPKGLKGEEIPIEARIMAIADVFDALVSKRCYKEPIPYEHAYFIIKDSMGKQFDPNLWKSFDKAYTKIVEYYKKNNNI